MKKLFNMDLHISVIKDISHILKDLYPGKIEVVNWSISSHSWVFNQECVVPEVINANNWRNIDIDTIHQFVHKYNDYLALFDGFIVTHTPVFSLLYETFNKPIILINSCRYEQPFSWTNRMDLWDYLNNKLKSMYEKKQLIVISNNKADAQYLKYGTGIDSYIIPSLCLYTNASYLPTHNTFIINDAIYDNNLNNVLLQIEYIRSKHSCLHDGYTWQQLYNYKGIIHMPYEISTMSIFEQYSANVPLFFPSKEYFMYLLRNNLHKIQSRYNKLFHNNSYHKNLDICLNETNWIDFWVNNADYYDEENMKYIVYFNDAHHLLKLIQTVNLDEISEKMKIYNRKRKDDAYQKWKNIIDSAFNL